ncbi:sigma-70 family RNA polymerase sigma factor [Virgisporangium aurantiacum]|uniref:RNA polymerase sigma24 factor n=1 Tax=Virgisporangium aurantiacum TaxID=175570 RepID=A0A8J4DXY6_9ACTN|nr:sigma-70 family RNA polymerase sigma factor [Virgisporangium aurantiacum]GIJ54071.1 RNA polymerase sigma24 factor [Virgisporangium aurantiacum]
MATTDDFHTFVAARLDRWRRSAYLMCDDWHLADDLVGDAVMRVCQHWSRVRRSDNPDAYAQKILARCWLTERRRAWWRRERTTGTVPETGPVTAHRQDERVIDRLPLAQLLETLGPRQRAAVILRYYLDYSVEETAGILGVTPSTVRGQCTRALEQLRNTSPTST